MDWKFKVEENLSFKKRFASAVWLWEFRWWGDTRQRRVSQPVNDIGTVDNY